MYKLQHTKVKHTLTMANLYSYTFSFQTNFSAMMGQIYVNFSIEIGSQLKIWAALPRGPPHPPATSSVNWGCTCKRESGRPAACAERPHVAARNGSKPSVRFGCFREYLPSKNSFRGGAIIWQTE